MKLLDIGTYIQNYKILTVLGYGGVGAVYLCEDKHLKSKHVVKEIFPSDLVYRGDSSNKVYAKKGRSKDFIKLLSLILKRVKFLAKFDHPSIPRIYSYTHLNNTFYIAMEYIKGNSLDEYIDNGEGLNEYQIISIFTPILDSVKIMHDNGVIHCDIKPINILIKEKSLDPVIIDLESARSFSNNKIDVESFMIVTDGYSAPEQYNPNKKLGSWIDIYSLGCTMYKAMFPRTPVPDAMHRVNALVNSEADPFIPAKKQGGNRFSQSLLEIVDSMVQISIDKRPKDIYSILEVLHKLGNDSPLHLTKNITPNKLMSSEYITKIISSEDKKKKVEQKIVNRNRVFFQVSSIIGGLILTSSLLNVIVKEPSFIIEIIVYSTGAALGFLLSRGRNNDT